MPRTRFAFPSRFALSVAVVALVVGTACLGQPVPPSLPFEDLKLVDEVVCAMDTTHELTQYPEDVSQVQTVLGKPCRVLPNEAGQMKYFAYRLGKGKGLQAHRGYVLDVEYPEDAPRTVFVLNRGCETQRGFHTGSTVGDALYPRYVFNNCESLDLPLSGKWEHWRMLFFLHERFPELKLPRGDEFPRDQKPEEGFWVVVMQLSKKNAPLSVGAAVSAIRLYEAPDLDTLTQPLAKLPAGLPERYLFWREEMSDAVVSSTEEGKYGVANDADWFEHKLKLMKFLGMNTFSKDLLEFGANQGWDSSKYGGNQWVYQSKHRYRWKKILNLCAQYDMKVLPYYEYCGSKGQKGLGNQKRCRPLGEQRDYTHIKWCEPYNADVTAPDTFEDLRRMLEITIVDEQDKASFVGAWLRQRPSQLPISFSDRCLGLFAQEANDGAAVAREQLRFDADLRDKYYEWWFGKRKQFFTKVRDYLRDNVDAEQVLLFTADSSEPGVRIQDPSKPQVITDLPDVWRGLGEKAMPLEDCVGRDLHLQAQLSPRPTWGNWEWQHSVPQADPQRYQDTDGVLHTYTLNRAYTALSQKAFDAFRTPGGLAVVRHYSLNEDCTTVGDDKRILGYFACDVDYAGPYSMMAEALAMAYGDPRYLGYLASSSFNRGAPEYARAFNANFLALPALPSKIDASLSADPNLIVRTLPTEGHGTYLAAVHVGRTASEGLALRLPKPGRVLDAVTGEELPVRDQQLILAYYPFQLRALRYFPAGANAAPEIHLAKSMQVEWLNRLGEGASVSARLDAEVIDYDAPGRRAQEVKWSVVGDGRVEFTDASSPATEARFYAPGDYVLRLTASDGQATTQADLPVTVALKERRLTITPEMVTELTETSLGCNLFDEQDAIGEPPSGEMKTAWKQRAWTFPRQAMVDLGAKYQLTQLWLYDFNGNGNFKVFAGEPDNWREIVHLETNKYKSWEQFEVDAKTRHLLFSMEDGGGTVAEVAVYERGGPLPE